jgi:copper homeostasis protein
MTTILHEIDYLLSNTKVSSIVFGSLTEDHAINLRQLESVIKLLENTGVGLTFHRAIDVSRDAVAAYQELQNYAPHLTRVLSSGGKDSAIDGSKQLATMQQNSRVVILLAGAGITPDNAADLVHATKVSEIHLGTGVRSNGKLDQSKFAALKNNLASV